MNKRENFISIENSSDFDGALNFDIEISVETLL